jgi:hypothetical protein
MIRTIGLFFASVLLFAGAGWSQPSQPPPVTTEDTIAAGEQVSEDDENSEGTSVESEVPHRLAFGPQEDGSLGATLKGDELFTDDRLRFKIKNGFGAAYLGLATDVSLNSATDALNQSALSLQPGLFFGGFWPGFLPAAPVVDVYLDIRQRYGQYKQEDESISNVNQLLVGAALRFQVPGAYALLRRIDQLRPPSESPASSDLPYLVITYYTVQDSSDTMQPIPEEIEVDKFVARLHGSLLAPFAGITLGLKGSPAPLKFSYDLSLTKPMSGDNQEWENLVDLALYVDREGQMKPVIQYKNGSKEGFKFDRQLIAGLLWQFDSGN